MNEPIRLFRQRAAEPLGSPPEPIDPLGYVTIPQNAQLAWATLNGLISRVRPTFAGSFAVAGKLHASAAELDAIAIAALKAAAAIRGMER